MAIPEDECLIEALKALRTKEPTLARVKVLRMLKTENGWELSDKRLKSCMAANNLRPIASAKVRDTTYNKTVASFFNEYTRLEREFYLTLSPTDSRALCSTPLSAVCSMRHHVEILLLLKGLKPCMTIHHHFGTMVFTRLTTQILQPLIAKHRLESYGFTLRQIKHATMIHTSPNSKPTPFCAGGWVFADTTSPLWHEVQDILLPKKEMYVSVEERWKYEDRIGRVLGYPARYPRSWQSVRRVRYWDEGEGEVLGEVLGKRVEKVVAVEFLAEGGVEGVLRDCLVHFKEC